MYREVNDRREVREPAFKIDRPWLSGAISLVHDEHTKIQDCSAKAAVTRMRRGDLVFWSSFEAFFCSVQVGLKACCRSGRILQCCRVSIPVDNPTSRVLTHVNSGVQLEACAP